MTLLIGLDQSSFTVRYIVLIGLKLQNMERKCEILEYVCSFDFDSEAKKQLFIIDCFINYNSQISNKDIYFTIYFNAITGNR